jgi:RNA polymerase sigma-70 factor (ECF subfamily)
MSSRSEVVDAMPTAQATPFDFEATFRAQYARIARVIARVVRDHARSEELAVEVFLKFWRCPEAHGDRAEGWLYRTAVRKGLDELRSEARRTRYEKLFGFGSPVRNPEQLHAASEEQDRVRNILASIGRRHAELLLLRSNDFSYEELASALHLNPASVGKLLSRAQDAFRKEYVNRYGQG